MAGIIDRVIPGRRTSPAAEIRERYEEAKRAQAWEARQYGIVRSYLGGDQWLYHSRQNDTVEIIPNSANRVRVTDNRIASNTRVVYAKLLRRPLQFDVLPKSSDDAVMRASRLTQSVIADCARRQRWEQTVRRPALSAMWESGTAVLSVDWDAKAGTPVGVGERGPIGTGDVRCTVSTVSEAFCEPGTIDIESAWWWIRSQALPPEHVQRVYGLSEKPKADVSADYTPSARRAVGRDKSAPLTLVLTYYERPSQGRGGKVCVVVGDDLVSEDPWPFPFKDHLNCVAMRETFVAHRWTGDSTAYQAISLQNAINHNISALVEHAKKAGNARLLVPDLALDLIDELTDEAGEIIPFNATGGKPEWLGPAQLSNWLVELGERLDARLDNIMGVHDVSRGTAPASIESGVGLSILAENDDTPIGFIAKEMAEGFGRMASMCAQLFEANVGDSREARVRSDDGVTDSVRWKGKDLMGQTEVVVPLEAVVPRSREAQRARAMEMVKFGFIKTIDEFEMIADTAPFDRAVSRLLPAVDKARRENHLLASGAPVMPADFDDHRAHIDEHNRFRMALGVSMPVLTPTGWKRMGDLVVGDRVIGVNGLPIPVKAVIDFDEQDTYRLTFNDHSWVDVDIDHLWTCKGPRERWSYRHATGRQAGYVNPRYGQWVVRSTRELLETWGSYPTAHNAAEMPVVAPVDFASQDVPLDAYTLGAILGDGTIGPKGVQFTATEVDIVNELRTPVTKLNRPYSYYLPKLAPTMKVLGLTHHRLWEKFVPDVYLWNSAAVRLGVLQGLMDTDGTCGKNGHASFATASSRLRDDVIFLVRSLGGKATVHERMTTKYAGKYGGERAFYEVNLSMPVNPFRLERKAIRFGEAAPKRILRSIERVGREPVRCITVGADDGLFVTKDFIVTHNSRTYELLGDDIRGIVDDHVQAHEVLAAEDAAKKLMQTAQSPALAAAPEANAGEPLPLPPGGGASIPPPPGAPSPEAPPPMLGGGPESVPQAP